MVWAKWVTADGSCFVLFINLYCTKTFEKVEGYDASVSHLLCVFIFRHNDVNLPNMSVPLSHTCSTPCLLLRVSVLIEIGNGCRTVKKGPQSPEEHGQSACYIPLLEVSKQARFSCK